MKVLFVTNMYPCPERPAYGTFVWQQAEQLRQFGHVVDVVTILGFQSKVNYLKGALEVLRSTNKTVYDIVHAHYGLSAFPAWFRVRAPMVVTLHGSDLLGDGFTGWCTRAIPRFADAVIVVSEEMRRRIPGTVIPCGVDLNVFKPYRRDEARSRLAWPQDTPVVLFPFDPKRAVKRFDLAKAAVAQVAQEGTNVELVTISTVKNHEMPWYYSAANAMIICSNWEGSPTSVKEALACNLPVVATGVGDIPEILAGISGTRICKQEVSDLACGLRSVLAMSRSGNFDGRSAMRRYDQPRTVQKVVNVYTDVLRRHATRASGRSLENQT